MKNMNKKVSIILVNYNGDKYNEECINSILQSNYKNIEIIFIDNCSTDNSVCNVKKLYDNKIKIIINDKNGGFAYGNNIGIKYALDNGADYILLLNNDTVIEKDSITNLVNASIRTNSVISPKIKYYDNRELIWSAGGFIDWRRGNAVHYGIDELDFGQYDEEKYIEFATGCCILLHKDIISQVGYLSEEYFLYFEDSDYCMKIIESGNKIFYCPSSIIYHKVSASTGGEKSSLFIYYINRNRLLFNMKFNKKLKIFLFYFKLLNIYKILRWIIWGEFELVRALVDSLIDSKNNIYNKSNKY